MIIPTSKWGVYPHAYMLMVSDRFFPLGIGLFMVDILFLRLNIYNLRVEICS